MLTLFGSAGSGSAAVEMALLHCGLAYRVERASTWEADSAQAELQRINPLGQVPALRLEDGSVVTESAAILIHLGLAQPQSGLLPADPAARAQVLRGLVFVAANCYAAIGIIDYPERWLPAGAEAPALAALKHGTRARLHVLWEQFADTFAADTGAGFLSGGSRPGALDYLAAVIARWAGARSHLRSARPQLARLFDRVEADSLVAPVFERHWPASST